MDDAVSLSCRCIAVRKNTFGGEVVQRTDDGRLSQNVGAPGARACFCFASATVAGSKDVIRAHRYTVGSGTKICGERAPLLGISQHAEDAARVFG